MKYHIILENVAGKLDENIVIVSNEDDLVDAVADFVSSIGMLRDGDVIRIVEMEG
jgi:hypothetical protein